MAMSSYDPPDWLRPFLYERFRWKIAEGGRGSGKSYNLTMALMALGAVGRPLRILCAREYRVSLDESSHALMRRLMLEYPALAAHYNTYRSKIVGRNGTEIIFKGISDSTGTAKSVRSMEAIDIAFLEEGQYISQASLDTLIPTIRKPGSEIWSAMNPRYADDPVYKMAMSDRSDVLSVRVNWQQNKYWSAEQEAERLDFKRLYPERYDHVYEGALDDFGVGLNQVLTRAMLTECMDNASNASDAFDDGLVEVGFDPADQGSDLNSVTVRQGPCIVYNETWSGKDSNLIKSTNKALAIAQAWNAYKLWYDATGIGSSVYAALEEIDPDIEHEGIHFGSSPGGKDSLYTQGQTNGQAFSNRYAQMCIAVRERAQRTAELAAGDKDHDPMTCLYIDDEVPLVHDFCAELTQPIWAYQPGTRKVRIEKTPKGTRSPNRFDSTVLAFAGDTEDGLSHGAVDAGWGALLDML